MSWQTKCDPLTQRLLKDERRRFRDFTISCRVTVEPVPDHEMPLTFFRNCHNNVLLGESFNLNRETLRSFISSPSLPVVVTHLITHSGRSSHPHFLPLLNLLLGSFIKGRTKRKLRTLTRCYTVTATAAVEFPIARTLQCHLEWLLIDRLCTWACLT